MFLNSGLLWLLGLGIVPIILHLLFRRRFREVNWAPMRLLLLTVQRTRRRRRIEELLLLLLRVLAVLLIALAVSRPAITAAFAAGLFGGDTERVVIIDDSLSMARPAGNSTSLNIAREQLRALLSQLPRGARVTIISATNPDTPLLNNAAVDATEQAAIIDAIVQTDAATHWDAVFQQAADRLTALAGKRAELIILSDAQANGWNAGVADPIADLEGVSIRYFDAGAADAGNLVLTTFERGRGGLSERGLIRFRAVVRNPGELPATDLRATLTIDEQAHPVAIPDIPAAGEQEVIVQLSSPPAGLHTATFELQPDTNIHDNRRHLILPVGAGADVVVVDGEAAAGTGGSVWLETALAIGDEGWRVHRYTQDEWNARAPVLGDVLMLLDATAMPAGHARVLSEAVTAGRVGLMIFPGERSAAGPLDPILPGRFLPASEESADGLYGPWPADAVTAALADIAPAALLRVQARRVQRYAKAEDTLAVGHWGSNEGAPVLLQRRIGKGMTIAWSVGANRDWSDWPVEPSWLLCLRSATQSLLPDPGAGTSIEAGDRFHILHKTGAAPDSVMLLQEQPVPIATVAGGDDDIVLNTDTRQAGIYRFESLTGQERQPHWFAVSPAAAEAAVERIDAPGLQAAVAPIPVHWTTAAADNKQQGGELWLQAVMFLMAVLIIEPGLTLWMVRNRGDRSA